MRTERPGARAGTLFSRALSSCQGEMERFLKKPDKAGPLYLWNLGFNSSRGISAGIFMNSSRYVGTLSPCRRLAPSRAELSLKIAFIKNFPLCPKKMRSAGEEFGFHGQAAPRCPGLNSLNSQKGHLRDIISSVDDAFGQFRSLNKCAIK